MLVMKFGGTSVQDAEAFRNVIEIITSRNGEQGGLLVVLSATSGTTTTLLDIARASASGIDVDERINELELRHRSILIDLTDQSHARVLEALFGELRQYVSALLILGEVTAESLDRTAAYGEQLSTTILTNALQFRQRNAEYLDAGSVITTEANFVQAPILWTETRSRCTELLAPRLRDGNIIVTQGFIGATSDGRTTTLGRGGSDYSAAVFGACLGAREIEIWTDVSGVYSADPRLIADAHPIPELSFAEVRELALYGARVLHPETIAPAIEALIPVRVLNTFKANEAGTLITVHDNSSVPVHAVSIVRNVLLIQGSTRVAQCLLGAASLAKGVLLQFSSIDHSSVAILDEGEVTSKRVNIELAQLEHSRYAASILTISGPYAGSASILAQILQAMGEITQPLAITTGTTSTSVFIVVKSEYVDQCAIAIHNAVIRRPHPSEVVHL